MTQTAVADQRPATFRDRLEEWTNRTFHTSLARLSSSEQSKKMTLFYLEEILAHTDPQLVPEDSDDLQEGIVDQPGERGVDFICTQDNKVFIAQCKYHSKKARPEPDKFSYFRSVLVSVRATHLFGPWG